MNPEEYANFVPMEFKSGKETLKNIPNRCITLVWKLISMQGVALVLGTYLVIHKSISDYVWLFIVLIVLFGRYALDFVKELKK